MATFESRKQEKTGSNPTFSTDPERGVLLGFRWDPAADAVKTLVNTKISEIG